jgi:hypothetical protein
VVIVVIVAKENESLGSHEHRFNPCALNSFHHFFVGEVAVGSWSFVSTGFL